MYFNDVHILIYVALAIVGFFIGKFVNWMNYRFLQEKKIFSKEFFEKHLDYKPNLILSNIYYIIIYIWNWKNIFK